MAPLAVLLEGFLMVLYQLLARVTQPSVTTLLSTVRGEMTKGGVSNFILFNEPIDRVSNED
jgi:hypothetical protein